MTENIIIIMLIVIFYFIGANDRKIKELKEKYENKGTEKQKQDEATKKEMEKAKKIRESFDELMQYDYEQALKNRSDRQ